MEGMMGMGIDLFGGRVRLRVEYLVGSSKK